MSVLACSITEHHDDGGVTTRTWGIDEDTAARLLLALGDPHAVQLLTPSEAAQVYRVADRALTVDAHHTTS